MNDKKPKPFDPIGGLRFFLFGDLILRTWIWSLSLMLTFVIIRRIPWLWPEPYRSGKPFSFDHLLARFDSELGGVIYDTGNAILKWIFLYNVVYVLVLLVLRLITPTPKEGRYPLTTVPNLNLLWSCFVAILTKARYEAPFPGFLVFHVANIPPFVWAMNYVFGPRSKSCYVVDPRILDPSLVTIGRNVTIGFGTIISGHTQERGAVTIARTVIEDDVLFGGNVIVYGGCTIKRGAILLGGAVLKPFSVVGEYEVWGGVPAEKKKVLPPPDHTAPPGGVQERITEAG